MKTAIEKLAARLTARKGNHPLLWIVFGALIAFGSVASAIDGSTLLGLPLFVRAFQDFSAPRFQEISFAAEPILFLAWVGGGLIFAAFCLAIGSLGLIGRSKARKKPHPLSSIIIK